MRFIKVWSYSCANYLMKQLKESHEKRGVYYYGFQIVIGAIVKGILLVSTSYLIGSLVPTMIILLFFATLRMLAGGYHMDTYGKCISISLTMFLLSGAFVQYTQQYWAVQHIIALMAVTFAVGLFVIIKWAPADTPNKPITRPEDIKRLKILSIVHISAWVILNSVFIYSKIYMHALSSCFGIIIAIFIVSPIGYRFFDMVSGKVDEVKKKKVKTTCNM